ncbi:hypothetical protein [Novosphingobium resinovorum]|uniref:Uncharacterized protein n=1 Tax=Novosphingobium resinovorum TaxID=158500 RepID=A0A1D8A399_9SPHN|nr:hypothetical protein [Novosphingobium resinovorum]AOR76574.1 hypothetical protein BES08_07290 [Novosphingobium resinovorum]
MGGIRDIKRAARQRLHTALAVRAFYIPVTGASPVPVTVRIHTKFDALGDPQMMQRADIEPQIVFQASQLPVNGLRNKAVVSVEAGEAYHIEAADPVDDAGFITARVTKLPVAQTTGLPVPA